MLRPCVFLVAVLCLVACSRHQALFDPQEVSTDSGPALLAGKAALGIELRSGGLFSEVENRWMRTAAASLAQALGSLPSTPILEIPIGDPFHRTRLMMEGVVAIEGVRVYVEPLEDRHFRGQDNGLIVGFGQQVYTRNTTDLRTSIGVVLVHQGRIGKNESLFKRNFIHQLSHALGVGIDLSCYDLSLSIETVRELGYEVDEDLILSLLKSLDIPPGAECLSPSLYAPEKVLTE